MARGAKPAAEQDKYILRLPDGMRDRIKKAAERSGRSMNAEIIAALETYYPEEPSIEDVLDRVHRALAMGRKAESLPYRKVLIEALDEFAEQIAGGLEFDQFRAPYIGKEFSGAGQLVRRLNRWRRAQKHGVEQSDLERELSRGMLRNLPGDRVRDILFHFKEGQADRALKALRLNEIKFADGEAAIQAIESDLRAYFEENWGDPDSPVPPWEEREDF